MGLQVDMLESQDEVDAVLQFVSSNASKLLQVRLLDRAGCQKGCRVGSGRVWGVLPTGWWLVTSPAFCTVCEAAEHMPFFPVD